MTKRFWRGILVFAVTGLAGSTASARIESTTSTTECPDAQKFVNILNQSSVGGTIEVSPQAGDPANNVYVSGTSAVAPTLTSPPTPPFSSLAVPLMPSSVAPPENATDLGDTLVLHGQTMFLDPGVYRANRLLLLRDGNGIPSTLYTRGAVELYVTGGVRQEGGRLYGQPSQVFPWTYLGHTYYTYLAQISDPNWNLFSPSNLRIVVVPGAPNTPAATPSVNLSSGITAALVYATGNIPVTLTNHTLLGAAIGQKVSAENSKVYYHEDLSGVRFDVHSTDPAAILEWYRLQRVPIEQTNNQFGMSNLIYWNPWAGTPEESGAWVSIQGYGWWSWPSWLNGSYTGSSSSSGGSSGCFLAGTPITLADGTTKPIEQIQLGDVVLAFDEATKTFKPDAVKKLLVHPNNQGGYWIVNGHLHVTPNHRVYHDGQWVRIGTLKVGDTLFNAHSEPEPITSIEHVPGAFTVYNFEVNPYHTYIAGGVVVHNGKGGGN